MVVEKRNDLPRYNADTLGDLTLVEAPRSRQIQELVAYWDGKRGARFAPARADIDPTEIPGHLSHLFLLDVIDGGRDFRCRLIGTELVEGLGRDSAGRRIGDMYAGQPAALAKVRRVSCCPSSNAARASSRAASSGCRAATSANSNAAVCRCRVTARRSTC